MTRQMRRQLERQQAKFRTTFGEYPNHYGAYYKDDQSDGFLFTTSDKEVIKDLMDCADKGVKEYNESTPEQKREMIEHDFGFLKQEIKAFNKAVGMPEGRPKGWVPKGYISQAALKAALVCSVTIDFLTRVGAIKNDNYNGMAFTYEKGNTTVSVG